MRYPRLISGEVSAFGIALLLVLLLAAFQSARLGMAGLMVEIGQQEVDRWVPKRRRDTAEIERAAGYFTDSLAYDSRNPWALEGLGSLELARMRQSAKPQDALQFAESARSHFREALRERPTSPFLWANLALAKLYLDQIDSEFLAALRNADELGPWEPASQQLVLIAGLGAWQKLDPVARRSLVNVVERGSLRNGRKIFEIVKTYRRLDLVCTLKSYDAVAAADCLKADAAVAPGAPESTRRGKPR